jgi:hypothetical protein
MSQVENTPDEAKEGNFESDEEKKAETADPRLEQAFEPDCSLIDLSGAKQALEAKNLATFESQPLVQIAKSLSGYGKLLNLRQVPDVTKTITEFLVKLRLAITADAPNQVQVALLKIYQSTLYSSTIDLNGQPIPSKGEEAINLANEAFESICKIVGDDDKYNYLRSKA